MAYIPQTGIGGTLTINSVAYTVRDMNFQSSQELFECSSLTDKYRNYLGARRSGKITATLLVSSDAANGIVTSFQSVAALGAAVTFVLNDAASVNTYSGSGFVEDATHNMTGTDVDTLAISMTVSGTIA